MPFHGHTIVLTALQALSRPLQQSEGPSKSLSKMERKSAFRTLKMLLESLRVLVEDIRIFVEAVCAGPGHENACRGRAGAGPANGNAVESAFKGR